MTLLPMARPDPESSRGVRSLLCEIWYPAEDEARRLQMRAAKPVGTLPLFYI